MVLRERAPAPAPPPGLGTPYAGTILFLRIIVSLVLENFLNTGTGKLYKVFENYVKRSVRNSGSA